MEKITKADLRQPDLFVESAGQSWVFVEKHFKVILSLFLLAVVASGIYIAKNFFDERSERHAMNDLFPVESEVLKLRDGFDRAKRNSIDKAADQADQDPKKAELKKATGDLQADYGASLTNLESFANSHQDVVAGAEAALIASGIYSDYQKADKSVALLAPIAKKFSSGHSPLISGLLQMALGTAQATQGDCKSAIASWQKVIENDRLKFLSGDAHIKSGVCSETLGDLNAAKDHYEKASSGEANVGKNAKTLLRALEVKKAQAG